MDADNGAIRSDRSFEDNTACVWERLSRFLKRAKDKKPLHEALGVCHERAFYPLFPSEIDTCVRAIRCKNFATPKRTWWQFHFPRTSRFWFLFVLKFLQSPDTRGVIGENSPFWTRKNPKVLNERAHTLQKNASAKMNFLKKIPQWRGIKV